MSERKQKIPERDPAVRWFREWYPDHHFGAADLMEEGVVPRLRGLTVNLFTPWGPRYSYKARGVTIRSDDREILVLNRLANILSVWREKMPGKQLHWLFLGADLYGSQINHLPADVVAEYFRSLESWLREIIPTASFCLWSDIASEAECSRLQIEQDFDSYISPELMARAAQTAEKMEIGGDPRAYLVERVAEAMMIEQLFSPIKISCVGGHKNRGLDGEIPSLYLVPEHLHAPWL